MAYREVSRVEIAEVVRRWQSGISQRGISTGTGLSRATVRRYIEAVVEAGLARDGPAPSEEQLARLAGLSIAGPRKVEIPTEEVLGPWADQVYEWLTADRLQVTRIHELLAGRGCRVSYTSLRRFIQRRGWQRRSPATVRMGESAPGEVAEMDFGRLGLIEDPATGRRRVAWALIIVLTYSRHSFVWPTFSQKLVDVIEGLEAAWAFFEGVPKYLVIDNFPAAVAGVDPLHPRLTRGFLEYSQHRGFISDPARVRHPRDKPRVERGVPYVRERFFKGGEFRGLSDMRSAARRWCLEVAGQRVHGTTRKQPLVVFRDEERHALGEWDRTVFRRLLAPDFDRSGFGFDTPASPVHAYVLAFFVARNAASLSSGPAPRYCAGEPAGAGAAGVKPRTQSDSSLTSPCSLMALMRYTYCLSGSTVSSV